MDSRIVKACEAQAERLGVPAANLLAFVEVESNGVAFAANGGQNRALIRWEGHYFYRRLQNDESALNEAVETGLAGQTAGSVPNPRDQGDRYAILTAAMDLCRRHGLDPDLACECVSVGLGQVMAANWRSLGYQSAHDMIVEAHDETPEKDIADQIEMMGRYLTANGLVDELQRGDWTALARAYNGPGYAKNAYDTKLAAAYRRWSGGEGSSSMASEYPTLKLNDSGPLVQALQARLAELGYPRGSWDGHFGPIVRQAVLSFQADHGLPTDGVAGPATWRALEKSSGRPMSAGRATATVRDLRNAGSGTIKAADYGQAAGAAVGGLGAAGGLSTVQTNLEAANGIKAALSEFWGTGQDLLPFLLIVAGAGVFIAMQIVKRKRLADHQSGANLGR